MVYCHEWPEDARYADIFRFSCKNKATALPLDNLACLSAALKPVIGFACDTRGIPDIPGMEADEFSLDEALATTRSDIAYHGAAFDTLHAEKLALAAQDTPDQDFDRGRDSTSDCTDSDTSTSEGEEEEEAAVAKACDDIFDGIPPDCDDDNDDRPESERFTDSYYYHDHMVRVSRLHAEEWLRRDALEPDDPDNTLTSDDKHITERSLRECREWLGNMVVGELDHGGAQLFIT